MVRGRASEAAAAAAQIKESHLPVRHAATYAHNVVCNPSLLVPCTPMTQHAHVPQCARHSKTCCVHAHATHYTSLPHCPTGILSMHFHRVQLQSRWCLPYYCTPAGLHRCGTRPSSASLDKRAKPPAARPIARSQRATARHFLRGPVWSRTNC